MKMLIVLMTLFQMNIVQALVTCSPSSCSPPCDGSCTYYVCDQDETKTFEVKKLPMTNEDSEPANACLYTKLMETKLPFTFQSITYSKLPMSITNKYKTCRGVTISGPACPPPAISPPAP